MNSPLRPGQIRSGAVMEVGDAFDELLVHGDENEVRLEQRRNTTRASGQPDQQAGDVRDWMPKQRRSARRSCNQRSPLAPASIMELMLLRTNSAFSNSSGVRLALGMTLPRSKVTSQAWPSLSSISVIRQGR
jgi:hypothetical protein